MEKIKYHQKATTRIKPVKFKVSPQKGDKVKVYAGNPDLKSCEIKYGTVKRIELKYNEDSRKWREIAVLRPVKKAIPFEKIKFFLPQYKVRFLQLKVK